MKNFKYSNALLTESRLIFLFFLQNIYLNLQFPVKSNNFFWGGGVGIQWISLYTADKMYQLQYIIIHWIATYPLGKVYHPLNNWGQYFFKAKLSLTLWHPFHIYNAQLLTIPCNPPKSLMRSLYNNIALYKKKPLNISEVFLSHCYGSSSLTSHGIHSILSLLFIKRYYSVFLQLPFKHLLYNSLHILQLSNDLPNIFFEHFRKCN